ncbi:hypothetical protein LVY65_08450 [Sphingomonas sp. G124]|uniref:Uncharacterized protein n=1 Tax=Sphingomonas cremea TaxID=2904799 RepID=A0A9X1QL48_9SPHN|nr:hypothetical protein [Sphingomonas cremea]MCF2515090.1 hypothetical protein [Sphingomonas cremea]
MRFWLTIAAVAQINPVNFSTYMCLDSTMFALSASNEIAIVRFQDGEYLLPRRSSTIAIKYASKEATLYLDGELAAFVADDRPLPGCHKVEAGERG